MILMMVVITFGGRLSDKFGRRPVLAAGCIGFFLFSWPALQLVQTGTGVGVFFGLLILGVVLVTFTSTMPSTLPALFPTIIRYGALAIAFNVSVSLFGGTTPLATAALINGAKDAGFGWAEDIPAFYLMAAALIGLVAVYFTKETASTPLMGSGPTVASEAEVAQVIDEYNDPSSEFAQSDWAKEFSTSEIPVISSSASASSDNDKATSGS